MPAEPENLDPERRLALAYVGAARAPALATLWRLDGALAALVRAVGQPMIAQIKLAWWREALAGLDEAPPPAEPLLQAVSAHLLAAGISGAELAPLVDGWEYLVGTDILSADDLDAYAAGRGSTLFRLSARLLGATPARDVERAGGAWALVDLARHNSETAETNMALDAAADRLAEAPFRWPTGLRPLGMLTVLARRDVRRGAGRFERQGSPARMLAMILHRLTGR